MGFLNFLKKKKVPDQLPDLLLEEKPENNEIVKETLTPPEEKPEEAEKSKENLSSQIKKLSSLINLKPSHEEVKEKIEETIDEDSYFEELQKDLIEEIKDLNKLEEWYKKKFLPADLTTNLRNYWENKKAGSVLGALGKEYKEQILQRIKNLQTLEREWQQIYFELIEKEEEIKDEEIQLKKILKEFIELCKRKKGKN